MRSESQPMLPFGVHPMDRVRDDFPFGAADARREAHAKQTPARTERMWGRIMEYARAHENFTADEVAADWKCSPNHTAPRICELLQLGRLKMTGERRKTRAGGWAAVLKERNNE